MDTVLWWSKQWSRHTECHSCVIQWLKDTTSASIIIRVSFNLINLLLRQESKHNLERFPNNLKSKANFETVAHDGNNLFSPLKINDVLFLHKFRKFLSLDSFVTFSLFKTGQGNNVANSLSSVCHMWWCTFGCYISNISAVSKCITKRVLY